MSASARNGAKSVRRQHRGLVIHPRQRLVAVDAGAAVSGYMLDDRQHAAFQQSFTDRAPQRRDAGRIGPPGAVADHRIGAGRGRSRTGAASTVMPSSTRSSAISRADRCAASSASGSGSAAIRRGRIGAPFRRTQARHSAALLVDQDRSVRRARPLRAILRPGRGPDRGSRNCAGTARSRADRPGEKPPLVEVKRSPATPRTTARDTGRNRRVLVAPGLIAQ